ncbi:MAG: hypothetical protein H0U27_14820 [Nitrosopumilus sp.]|nr:hypothetical protein [Nitrosopumilus sp.]
MSNDGKFIVGKALTSPIRFQSCEEPYTAFIWSETEGMKHLFKLKKNLVSSATHMSRDSKRVFGIIEIQENQYRPPCSPRPFIYARGGKSIFFIQSYLRKKNLLPKEYTLTSIRAISPNGIHVIGEAEDKNNTILWKATIPRFDLF